MNTIPRKLNRNPIVCTTPNLEAFLVMRLNPLYADSQNGFAVIAIYKKLINS